MSTESFPELGFYTLPGHAVDVPRSLDEVRVGEELGLGSVWISERLGAKDVGVLSGAAAAVSSRLRIASGLVANLPLRHPAVVASYGSTMSLLSGGRFVLGIGRGMAPVAASTGTPRLTFEILQGYVNTIRALWRGMAVTGSVAGWQLNGTSLGLELAEPPPIVMAVEGDRTAEWAGAICDGVFIQGLWNVGATAHTVERIRAGAERAGRDPDDLEIVEALITACEVPEEEMLRTVVRRWNTYLHFPAFLDNLCRINDWDRAEMERVRTAILDISVRGRTGSKGPLGDENVSRDLDDLRRCRDLYPDRWLHEAFAVGDRDHCARETRARMDAGCDGIVLHGSTPANLAPLLEAWPAYRPAAGSEALVAGRG